MAPKEKKNPEEMTDREMLRDIYYGMYGHEKNDQKGLIQKVKEHGEYIKNDRRFKWIGAGLVTGISVGLDGIVEYVKKHFGI